MASGYIMVRTIPIRIFTVSLFFEEVVLAGGSPLKRRGRINIQEINKTKTKISLIPVKQHSLIHLETIKAVALFQTLPVLSMRFKTGKNLFLKIIGWQQRHAATLKNIYLF